MKKTVFSFDFDNTISRDPTGFLHMMEFLKNRGHTIYVVTARLKSIHPEDFDLVRKAGYEVIHTEHKAKQQFMIDRGTPVDVFIDDCPDALLNNYYGEPRTYRDMVDEG